MGGWVNVWVGGWVGLDAYSPTARPLHQRHMGRQIRSACRHLTPTLSLRMATIRAGTGWSVAACHAPQDQYKNDVGTTDEKDTDSGQRSPSEESISAFSAVNFPSAFL